MTVLLLHAWWMNVGSRALTGWEFEGAHLKTIVFFFLKDIMVRCLLCIGKKGL